MTITIYILFLLYMAACIMDGTLPHATLIHQVHISVQIVSLKVSPNIMKAPPVQNGASKRKDG